MNTNRAYRILVFSILFVCSSTLWANGEDKTIKVMTLNEYIGADLKPILETLTRHDFNDELVAALRGIAANRFLDRVQRQAAIIAQQQPDVVALQEVWGFQCEDVVPASPKQGCNDPTISGAFVDFLKETLSALNSQGLNYRAVSKVKNLDLSAIRVSGFPPGIPFVINGSDAVLNGIDRDVILVRNDIPARAVNFSRACPNRASVNGCTYDLLLTTPTPIGPITLLHGFTGADVKVNRKNYRIINTHLEQRDPFPFIQADQANELINTLRRTTPTNKSLLILGDMNSSPRDSDFPGIAPPYQQFIEAGFTDTWKFRRPASPGFTCCQAEDLSNKRSLLNSRIDFIFSQRAVKRGKVNLVGMRQTDKTAPPKLWPTDHAGIVAELHY